MAGVERWCIGSNDVESEINAPAKLDPRRVRIRRLRFSVVAGLAPVLLGFCLIFATHHRWVLTHFSSDAYIEDSGWLAYLFESADPLLNNPSGVNGLSFYAHHLSPHLFLFGAPLARSLDLTGVEIFAVHQGFFFGLFFLACCVLVGVPGLGRRDRFVAAVSALALGGLSNPLFQAAAYPHYEIAMVSIALLAVALWLARYRALFGLCLLWLPLVREDGGFYVAVACLACAAAEHESGRGMKSSTRLLIVLALGGLAASASSFLIKAWFFPGFSAFANNFSGKRWDHVTTAFLLERLQALTQNLNAVPVLVGCALLSWFDLRYLTGLVLLSPVLLLHILAVRPEHGYFTLYFALPWLLVSAIWLAVFVTRSRTSRTTMAEGGVIVAAALALCAPVQAAVGARGEFWFVARYAVQRPVADIRAMQAFVRWARNSMPIGAAGEGRKDCLSQGIAALVPNEIRPDQVLAWDSDLRPCHALFLMRGDMYYAELGTRAKAAGFQPTNSRENAELWLIAAPR